MTLRKLIALAAALWFAKSFYAPASSKCTTSASANLITAIVVEKISKNSAAQKSGLREGDVITGWSRANRKGEISSPFDLSWVEEEQEPQGLVTLQGSTNGQSRDWVMGPEDWGILARPDLPPNLLSIYLAAQKLAEEGNFAEAAKLWRTGALQAQAAQSRLLSSWFLLKTAGLLAERQQWEEARGAYRDSIQEAQAVRPDFVPQILRDQADKFGNLGLDEEEKYYQQALTICRTLPEQKLSVAIILGKLATIARARGDLAQAAAYRQEALAIQERIAPHSLAVAASLNTLGIIAKDENNLDQAETYLLRSLQIKQRLAPESRTVLNTLNNLGGVAQVRGDLLLEEQYLRRAWAISEKLGIVNTGLLVNMGVLEEERGDFAQAEAYYLKYLEISKKSAPRGVAVGYAFNNLGNMALDRDDVEKAEGYLQQALEIREEIAPGSLDVADTLANLGLAAGRRHDFEKAEGYFLRTLDIQIKKNPDVRGTARTREFLGDLYRDHGDLAKAEECYRQALAMRETVAPYSADQAETLWALADIMRRKQQPNAAGELYEQALNALEMQLARLGGSEDLRSVFRSKRLAYYKNYIDLLLEENQPELAFQTLERSRARALLGLLTAAHLDIRQGVDPALLEQKRSLAAGIRAKTNRRIELLSTTREAGQVAALDKEIEKLLQQEKDVEERIRVSNPGYAALTQPRQVPTKEVQQLLDPETALLEYSLGQDRSHAFVLTLDSVKSYELPKAPEIEDAARRVYELVTARNHTHKGESEAQRDQRLASAAAAYPQAVAALSQKVLAPVTGPVGKKRLLIVADGALQYIPFALLPMPPAWNTANDTSDPTPPLVAAYEIVALPSASTLAVLRQKPVRRTQPRKAVAILADPVFDAQDTRITNRERHHGTVPLGQEIGASSRDVTPEDLSMERLTRSLDDVGLSRDHQFHLPRLPFTRHEAQAIVATVPPGQALNALDFQASRETATNKELGQYRIVHFATHGLLDSEHPELSGLVLSMVDEHGKHKNGYLSLEDIYNMNLPVDLVVLSACETGLGKEIDGEGIIGLTRGFMYAGASRVMASMWTVDDVATAELMKRFYQRMQKEGLRPAAALRRAQIEMWQQERWSSPYYWATFQIQGEWK